MFEFRLRFSAPSGTDLARENPEKLELTGSKEPIRLSKEAPRQNALPSDPVFLILDGAGFPDEQAALAFGRKLKDAVAVLSARYRYGFDVGKDAATSSVGVPIRKEIEERGFQSPPTVHGLQVLCSDVPVMRWKISARAHVSRSVKILPEEISAYLSEGEQPPKVRLALELYNASLNEAKSKARFLLLVTIVEVLAARHPRQGPAMGVIESWIEALDDTNCPEDDAERLKNGLRNLKLESISAACSRLVSEAGLDAQFFRRCYGHRSRLVHDGKTEEGVDVPGLNGKLDTLVRSLVLGAAGAAGE